MNPELNPTDIGRQLGTDGVNGVVAKAEEYCAHEERHIALKNHASIVALRGEFALLREEEQRIREQLRNSPPPGDLRRHRRKQIVAGVFAVTLTITSFFLAVFTFAPYRLGCPGYVFCLGIATVVPFLVEKLLEDPRLEPLVKALTAIAAVAGIASLMLLADVRGHLLAHEIQSAPAVVIDDAQPEPPPQDDFYSATLNPLCLATVLLSFAMELGAGLALREAWASAPHNAEDWKRLRGELAQIRRQMLGIVRHATELEDEPAIFKARFWRDFYRSMLTHAFGNAMRKLLVLLVLAALMPHARAATPPQLDLVIAIDLTRSEAIRGPDGITEFQKNLDGVARALSQVPAGTHVTVVGITDRSFALPYVLLSASLPEDAGYFGEKLRNAQSELVKVWKQRTAKLTPIYPGTDILGALRLASQIFEQQPHAEPKVLVIFSDMRNHTTELDMEGPSSKSSRCVPAKNRDPAPIGLHQVSVYALGVNGAGPCSMGWETLRGFWERALEADGAHLAIFSVLRELPAN